MHPEYGALTAARGPLLEEAVLPLCWDGSFWLVEYVQEQWILVVSLMHSFAVKWGLWSEAMLFRIPEGWIRHSVSPWVLVLAAALQTVMANPHPETRLVPVRLI